MTNFNNNLVFDANEHNKAIEYMKDYSENYKKEHGNAPKAFVHSYGCQQNVADGEVLQGLLNKMGYQLTDDEGIADFILYNTCAIRENAENTVFGNVGELKHLKEIKPEIIVGVCGCMTQQKHILDKISESYPFVDMIFGAGAMDTLPQLLAEKMKEKGKVFYIGNPTRDIVEDLPLARENNHQAYVSIMWGCDNFCTYCIVPYVRGRERSREPEQIIAEVKGLIAQGYKEITLLGQNVNSYGKGLDRDIDFVDLLEQVANLDGKFRIRFMTSHPKDCSKRLIDTMAKHDKIAKHLHLPVQSGSNRVLERMNRGYTVEEYTELVNYAKERIPNIAITSDLIIGFPGETSDDFVETLNLVEDVGYSSLYTFSYSPRKGTKAYDYTDKVSRDERALRFDQLLLLQRNKANEYNEKLVGKTFEVLVDSTYQGKADFLQGRTESSIIVIFPGHKSLVGNFVNVEITDYMNWAVEGKIVE